MVGVDEFSGKIFGL